MRNIEERRNYGWGGPLNYTKIFSGLVMVGINNCFYCCCKTWTMMGLLHTCLGNKLLTWDSGCCPHPPISWASSKQQQVKTMKCFMKFLTKKTHSFIILTAGEHFCQNVGPNEKTSSLGGRSPPSLPFPSIPFHPGRGNR